jgi:hypothetical protein
MASPIVFQTVSPSEVSPRLDAAPDASSDDSHDAALDVAPDAAVQRFPPTLLEATPAERIAYFKAYTVAHPRLVETDRHLASVLAEPAGAALVLVYGPTGVGKTTLLSHTRRRLTEGLLPTLLADPGRLPVVAVEAIAPDARAFNWKDYYLRALLAIDEPLIAHKRAPSWRFGRETAAPALRLALEQALAQRRPVAFLVDEAQHLAKAGSGRRLQDQLDCLKSLANVTGVVHVLFGTYDLLSFRNLSGQLGRRSTEIHLPRYRRECEADVLAFRRVLRTFQRHLPLSEEPDLLAEWEYCYERSIGCVGTLKDWLTRCLVAAIREGAPTLTRAHLEAHSYAATQALAMVTEASRGEAELDREEHGARERLRGFLGEPASAGTPRIGRKGPRAVGRRSPQRDPVGETADATKA